MSRPTTLTGNDIALAASACALAIAWWEGQRPLGEWGAARVAELKALSAKMQALSNAAYPHVHYTEDGGFNAPDTCGDEAIMRLDADVLAETTKLGAPRSSAEQIAAGTPYVELMGG